ncbi:MAG: FAD-binding domain-containing protein [Actinomycetota bacterium]
MADLPPPAVGAEVGWLRDHLGDLVREPIIEPAIHGGQTRADAALEAFSVRGYASRRNEVSPADRRGASGLSPYIRHGLLTLPRVWGHVADGPAKDVGSFRDELLWQEYARHLYARLGDATRRSLRYHVPERSDGSPSWPEGMACVDLSVEELRAGWLTNQQRMWLASQWTVRDGWGWRDGEDAFFRHLLDGSRAANRIGWQWTVGALTGKPYGFSSWQVEKRAPGLCNTCRFATSCPIQQWPPEEAREPRPYVDPRIRRDPDLAATTGLDVMPGEGGDPQVVWVTAESLGDDDPALRAHPDLPVAFVWDRPLLQRLRLSSTRLLFLAECVADLATRRDVRVHVGDPVEELRDAAVATTFAPVPGWRRRAEQMRLARVHAWPWLVPPHDGPVTSFTAWRRRARV